MLYGTLWKKSVHFDRIERKYSTFNRLWGDQRGEESSWELGWYLLAHGNAHQPGEVGRWQTAIVRRRLQVGEMGEVLLALDNFVPRVVEQEVYWVPDDCLVQRIAGCAGGVVGRHCSFFSSRVVPASHQIRIKDFHLKIKLQEHFTDKMIKEENEVWHSCVGASVRGRQFCWRRRPPPECRGPCRPAGCIHSCCSRPLRAAARQPGWPGHTARDGKISSVTKTELKQGWRNKRKKQRENKIVERGSTGSREEACRYVLNKWRGYINVNMIAYTNFVGSISACFSFLHFKFM